MAGIKGQPTPKPSDVESPIPGASEKSAFDAYMADSAPEPTSNSAFDSYMGAEQPVATPATPGQFPGAGFVQGAIEALPAVGAIAGGALGSAAGPLGLLGGAGLGGAAGQSLRSTLETALFGQAPESRQQFYGELGQTGLREAAGAATGEILGKAGAALSKTKAGQWVAAKASDLVSGPANMIKDSIQAVRDSIEEPARKALAPKVTSLNTEQAGDAAKSLLTQNIKTKYGPFIQAYSDLDSVAKAIPLKDEARRKFTQGLKAWSLENHSGENYRTVERFSHAMDAANTGKQFENVIGQINDAKNEAFASGRTTEGTLLKQLREQATDFLENETTKLAMRARAGNATPQELGFLQQIAQTRGIQEPDPAKYAESLAKDYLSAKTKISQDYSGFRSFLEDVGEQTKVKANRFGPMAFLDNINDVPSEKLIERMFDPKNAAALRRMRTETPEVFDQVVQSKMSELMRASTVEGRLDLAKLHDKLDKMPIASRTLLMDSAEMKTLERAVRHPQLKVLRSMEDGFIGKMGQSALDIARVAQIVGREQARAMGASQGGRQLMGRALNSVVLPPYPEQGQ